MPQNVSVLRSFLRLTNSKFVQGCANLVGSLTKRNDAPFSWCADCQAALTMQRWLFTVPVLIMPDYDKPLKLVTDACGLGIGASRLQEGRPIAFLCLCSVLLSVTMV